MRIKFFHKTLQAPGGWDAPGTIESDNSGSGTGLFEGAFDVVASDFDGDGSDEVLIFNGEDLRVFEKGYMGMPRRILATVLEPRAVDGVVEALPVDFDADGLDDLVLVNDRTVRLVRSSLDASGDLQLNVTAELPSFGGATRLAAIDVFGSAVPELVLLQDRGAPTLWIVGIEGGLFEETTRVYPRATLLGERIDLAPGDVDGDGDLDAVLFGHDGFYQAVMNDGGALTLGGVRPGGPATMLVDLDMDGDLDGICCGGGGGSISNEQPSTFHISLNQGALTFEPAVPFPGIGAHHVVAAHDFDDDGDLDVLAGRSALINNTASAATYCPQLANSTGFAGTLQATGSTVFSLGGPRVSAGHLPPNATSILLLDQGHFAGDHAVTPFWDGQLCLGNSILRVGLASADASGTSDFGLLIPNLAAITGGSANNWLNWAWALQVWHRDVRPGGSGGGVTNAIRLYLID